MKFFKTLDLIMQVSLLFYGLIYFLLLSPGNFITIYILISAGQLLSFLFHSFIVQSWVQKQQRKQYGNTLLWILALGLLAISFGSWRFHLLLFYSYGLHIASPFLAIWYFIISIKEISSINRRELIHLK